MTGGAGSGVWDGSRRKEQHPDGWRGFEWRGGGCGGTAVLILENAVVWLVSVRASMQCLVHTFVE